MTYTYQKNMLLMLSKSKEWDIKRILTNNGHLIFRVNSINDVNHGAGEGNEVEPHLYETSDKISNTKDFEISMHPSFPKGF